MVLGGNRSGKSECGAVEAVCNALGKRFYLPEDDPNFLIDIPIPNKGRICGEDYRNHIGNVIVPKLKKWIPAPELADVKRTAQGVEALFILANGSTIELMTYEQDSEKFEGSDNDWIWFDEPPPRDIFIAANRGLIDRGGKYWMTMTPLKEAWIKNEIWDKQMNKKYDIDGFIFDIMDNVGHGLTKKEVASFSQLLTHEEKEARLRGKFMHLSGLVYKEFHYQKHVVKPFDIPDDWPVYIAIDPHPRTPHAVMFMAVDSNGTKYIYDEIFKQCLINDLAAYIRAKLGDRKPKSVLIDPAASAPNPVTGVTIQLEFSQYGIYTIPASKDLSAGIQRVKKALTPPMEGAEPEIYVFDNCRTTIDEFNNYVWDEWRGKDKAQRSPKNKPKDKDDHMMENLYRLLLHNPRYTNRSYKHYTEYIPHNPITGY